MSRAGVCFCAGPALLASPFMATGPLRATTDPPVGGIDGLIVPFAAPVGTKERLEVITGRLVVTTGEPFEASGPWVGIIDQTFEAFGGRVDAYHRPVSPIGPTICSLDFPPPSAQNVNPVKAWADNFYAVWRERSRAGQFLGEGASAPPEKLLQTIWQHQRLRRDQLVSATGAAVRVLHPGFASAEGGPDFRGAVLQWENEPPVVGDVEVDVLPGGWLAHGHDRNPHFKNVILHVVWDAAPPTRAKLLGQPAVLPLQTVLDAPLAELALALEGESGLPAALRGQCAAPLRALPATELTELLHAAAQVRFRNKANALLARAKHAGWEQVLWENLFRALGYKHNIWPMQHLAETKAGWRRREASVFELQARLLGVSGLLPTDLTRAEKAADTFLRRAWDCWWRDRDALQPFILPRAVWRLHGLRPANHPQRRLALAAHWLAADTLVAKLESWGAAAVAEKNLLSSLQQILQVETDDFWSWHWTFKSARLAKPQPILGSARVTDLAVNVILPWLWIRGACAQPAARQEKFLSEIERRYFAWPAAEDNSVLKLARQRLLGSSHPRPLPSAAQQQGWLQIVRDFCDHSNAVCADCAFPDLVRSFQTKTHNQPAASFGFGVEKRCVT